MRSNRLSNASSTNCSTLESLRSQDGACLFVGLHSFPRAQGLWLPRAFELCYKVWAYFALNLAVPDRFTRPPAMSPTMPPAISNSNSSELHCKVGNCLIILPSSDLKVHQRDAHGRIPCDDSNCNTTFTLKSSKIRHMNTIHGEGKVPCEGCKSLFRKDKLDKGMQRCKSEFISTTYYGVKLMV